MLKERSQASTAQTAFFPACDKLGTKWPLCLYSSDSRNTELKQVITITSYDPINETD
jgi:hypothetical protein